VSNELASAGYIVELYNDIEGLNGYISQYKNIIIEFESKYMNENTGQSIDLKKIGSEEKERLLKIVPPIRHLIISINLKMNALKRRIVTFKELEEPEFKKKYELVINSPSPTFANAYDVTQKYNEVFVDGIIDSLLIQAQTIYSGANLTNAR